MFRAVIDARKEKGCRIGIVDMSIKFFLQICQEMQKDKTREQGSKRATLWLVKCTGREADQHEILCMVRASFATGNAHAASHGMTCQGHLVEVVLYSPGFEGLDKEVFGSFDGIIN